MKKQQLLYFVEVVECGTINKAAEKLYISQPSLSRSIQALEEEMGKQLIVRSHHGISMTPTGKVMYTYARSILAQFQVLEKLKTMEEEVLYSRLNVSVDSIFLRDDMILQFYERMNSTDTEIHFIETTAETVLQNVGTHISELGICILNDYQLNVFRKMAELQEVEITILGDGPTMVHIHDSNLHGEKDEIDVHHLLNNPFIHLPYDFFSNLNLSVSVDGTQLSSFKKTITMSNYHSIINMLNHTDAFILGHKWQVEELSRSHIRSLKIKNFSMQKHFVIVHNKREELSKAGKVFQDIVYENYGQL